MQIIIDSYGSHLACENGMLMIKPSQCDAQRVAVRKVTSILMTKGVSITSDAIHLALENDIQIIFIDKVGRSIGQVWNGKFGSIATIRKHQALYAQHIKGILWAKEQIYQKTKHQIAFMYQLAYTNEDTLQQTQKYIKIAEHILAKILAFVPDDSLRKDGVAASLRGWEGTASRQYFRMLSEVLPSRFQFDERSRKPAKDYFNSVLNYMYGMLYAIVELALIKAGIDPHIGILHSDQYNRPVMVFDFIEPYRIWVDTVAVRLFKSYALNEECFTPFEGGFWLSTTGKRVVIESFNDYMNEITILHRKKRKRVSHIDLHAQQLAKTLINFKP